MPDRITRQRAKGWRKPEGAVIVTRGTIWGNPWGIGTPGTVDLVLDGAKVRYHVSADIDQSAAAALYDDWLHGGAMNPDHLPPSGQLFPHALRLMQDHLAGRRKLILANLAQLRGHDLCCWCKPGEPCHADVLLRLANGGEV